MQRLLKMLNHYKILKIRKSKHNIYDIIDKEEKIENEDKYIEKLTDKLSEKI